MGKTFVDKINTTRDKKGSSGRVGKIGVQTPITFESKKGKKKNFFACGNRLGEKRDPN